MQLLIISIIYIALLRARFPDSSPAYLHPTHPLHSYLGMQGWALDFLEQHYCEHGTVPFAAHEAMEWLQQFLSLEGA